MSGFVHSECALDRIFFVLNPKEGDIMKINPSTPILRNAERFAVLFALAQAALTFGLFVAARTHLV